MKTHYNSMLFLLFIGLFSTNLFAQQGTVSGTLTSEGDNLPLPGVTILIKGTKTGVQTDFDGNYSITCRVGDTLVISYVGIATREVLVTPNMFGESADDLLVSQIPVKVIESNAYGDALKTNPKSVFAVPSLNNSPYNYNKQHDYQYERIKDVNIQEDKVNFTYFDPDIFYEIGINSTFGVRFFKGENLPQLQKTYAQGATSNGAFTFLGPETGNIFSFGPKLSNLEFDGSTYEYDTNGQLVPIGLGNGNPSTIYDNSVLHTHIKNSHHAFFNVSTEKSILGFNYTNTNLSDIFNREKSASNDLELSFRTSKNRENQLNWNVSAKYGRQKDNQPNINGFLNNTLLNAWATPVSFDNDQGTVLNDDSQRSFSPTNFNNPNWLLENNRNSEQNDFFVASLQNSIKLSDKINLKSILSYTNNKDAQNYGVLKNTVGFEDGYSSEKTIEKEVLNALLKFDFDNNKYNSNLKLTSLIDFSSESLDYRLTESTGFDGFSFNSPENTNSISNSLHRNTFRILNKVNFKPNQTHLELTVANNMYLSSLQENKWFLPYAKLKLDVNRLLDLYLNNFDVAITTSYDVKEPSLFYGNQSHNSLQLSPSQSLNYTANNDLFIGNSLQLEEQRSYEYAMTLEFNAFGSYFDFGATYFDTKTKGSVFPVFENNSYQLKNSADIRNRGIELSLSTSIELANQFYYRPTLVFSSNRTKVLKLNSDTNRIAIAGFTSVSKNLIVGERAGMIVGSAYARDDNSSMIIGADGFPLVAAEQQIIGDPTPDFNFGFTNNFTWNNFNLNLVLDVQKGGDVWNGTQNTLNYLGRSQQSAIERNVTNFIFNGVTQQGQQNTLAVDFYNPENDISQNRFVRYGFSGVDEDAIEDGSYINLKSIDLTYSFKQKNNKRRFIRQLDVGIYANNLVTWTKFGGASPYRNLYDNASGQGLNFFNMPITTEVGLTLNIKI